MQVIDERKNEIAITQSFDVIKWLRYSVLKSNGMSEKLKPSDIDNVLYFALVWNVFEDEIMDAKKNAGTKKSLNLGKIRTKIEELNNKGLLKIEDFKIPLENFRDRYITDGGINEKFELHFLDGELCAEANLKNVLLGKEDNIVEIVYACLTIAWRLRNNLFHGIKYINQLAEQNNNFYNVNQVLAKFVDLSR